MNWRPAAAAGFQGSLKDPLGYKQSQGVPWSPLPNFLPSSCSSAACETQRLEACRAL